MVTICTASLTFNISTFCPHSVFMSFVWISEQTAIISLYNINWLVCITETECVYCAVRTECLYVIQVVSVFTVATALHAVSEQHHLLTSATHSGPAARWQQGTREEQNHAWEADDCSTSQSPASFGTQRPSSWPQESTTESFLVQATALPPLVSLSLSTPSSNYAVSVYSSWQSLDK